MLDEIESDTKVDIKKLKAMVRCEIPDSIRGEAHLHMLEYTPHCKAVKVSALVKQEILILYHYKHYDFQAVKEMIISKERIPANLRWTGQ